MGLPIDIRFRKKYKKYFLGNRRVDVSRRMIRDARNNAIRQAWVELWNKVEKTIAKKTGRLRKSIFEMIMSQVRLLLARKSLTISFHFLSGPTWAKYHIFGPDGEAKTTAPYKNPSTPDTKPLNEFRFMDSFEDLIKKHMRIEFTGLGLNWKQFVKVL